MKAAVYRGPGDLRVEEIPRARSRARARCWCASRPAASAAPTSRRSRRACCRGPRIFGHEIAGTVARAGRGRRPLPRGRPRGRCTTTSPAGAASTARAGAYAQCAPTSRTAPRPASSPSGGGFAEYVKALRLDRGARARSRCPTACAAEEAAFVEPVNTCLKAVRKAGVERGPDGAGGGPGADRPAADAARALGGRGRARLRHAARPAARWRAGWAPPRRSTRAGDVVPARCARSPTGRGADVRARGRAGPAAVRTRRSTPRGRAAGSSSSPPPRPGETAELDLGRALRRREGRSSRPTAPRSTCRTWRRGSCSPREVRVRRAGHAPLPARARRRAGGGAGGAARARAC